ncbi:putative ankyrin repeat protein RF_0580 [Nasonia vitripennis]|uniref:Uncharacterized protein n=1 Tax=Nasonia vitripennis TaxID=7425 RepID=A0A7M7Q0X9_NASVI|nr:putative ankyrin repeat protein RF_0580 [Nasonia vitripennis]
MSLQSKLEKIIKEMLAKRRSLVNVRNHYRAAPLHAAFYRKRLVMLHLIRPLLKHGADPNAQNSFGNTALHLASRNVYMHKIVKELLKYGADINALNIYDHTALSNCVPSLNVILKTHALKLREVDLPLVQANCTVIEEI